MTYHSGEVNVKICARARIERWCGKGHSRVAASTQRIHVKIGCHGLPIDLNVKYTLPSRCCIKVRKIQRNLHTKRYCRTNTPGVLLDCIHSKVNQVLDVRVAGCHWSARGDADHSAGQGRQGTFCVWLFLNRSCLFYTMGCCNIASNYACWHAAPRLVRMEK